MICPICGGSLDYNDELLICQDVCGIFANGKTMEVSKMKTKVVVVTLVCLLSITIGLIAGQTLKANTLQLEFSPGAQAVLLRSLKDEPLVCFATLQKSGYSDRTLNHLLRRPRV